jgi:hypothetical protein
VTARYVAASANKGDPAQAEIPSARSGGDPDVRGRGSLRGRVLAWLPALTVSTVLVVALAGTDTGIMNIPRYALYVGFCLVLPGTLVFRALRRTPHTLVEDLTMGAVLGFVLEIPAWAAYSAADLRGLLWTWPLAVVLPFVAVPSLRRHWLPKGYRPVSPAWSWAVAGVCLAVIAYLWESYFIWHPSRVPPHAQRYFADLPYMLSLVGEAKHHFPMHVPQVASETLYYHWFAYAHEAAASMISGVDTTIVFYRLAVPVICLFSVLLFSVVGWRVSGSPWVGPVAAALTFVVGEAAVGHYNLSPFASVYTLIVWMSVSNSYGWLFLLGLAVVIADRLRASSHQDGGVPSWGAGAWVVMALLALAAPGAKSTILPVVVGGIGVTAAVHVVRHRRLDATMVGIGTVLLAGQAFGSFVIFHGESHGLTPATLSILWPYIARHGHRGVLDSIAALGFVGSCYVFYMMSRLAGIPVFAWLARRNRRAGAPAEWTSTHSFLLGTFGTGLAATLFLTHPTFGQTNFMRYGYLFGALLSAMGFVRLTESYRLPGRQLTTMLVVCVAVVALVHQVLLYDSFWLIPSSEWKKGTVLARMAPAFLYSAGLAAVIGAVAVLWRWWGRPERLGRGAGVVLALGTVLAAGVPVTVFDARNYVNMGWHSWITPDKVQGARWLRANSQPDQVLVTNSHCSFAWWGCASFSFWLEAYSERRSVVSGWGYAPRSADDASAAGKIAGFGVPFWDPALLALNDKAVYHPTAAILDRLWREHGARWIVVDRVSGKESPLLPGLADLRWQSGRTAIYQLRAPQGAPTPAAVAR